MQKLFHGKSFFVKTNMQMKRSHRYFAISLGKIVIKYQLFKIATMAHEKTYEKKDIQRIISHSLPSTAIIAENNKYFHVGIISTFLRPTDYCFLKPWILG